MSHELPPAPWKAKPDVGPYWCIVDGTGTTVIAGGLEEIIAKAIVKWCNAEEAQMRLGLDCIYRNGKPSVDVARCQHVSAATPSAAILAAVEWLEKQNENKS